MKKERKVMIRLITKTEKESQPNERDQRLLMIVMMTTGKEKAGQKVQPKKVKEKGMMTVMMIESQDKSLLRKEKMKILKTISENSLMKIMTENPID